MAEGSTNTFIRIILQGSTHPSFNSTLSQLQRIGNISRNMMFTISLPLIMLGREIIRVGVQFDQSLNVIRGATQATATEMERVSSTIMELSRVYGQVPTELASGVERLAQAYGETFGSIEEMMGFFPHVLNLSTAAQMDMNEAARGLINIMTAYHIPMNQAAVVNDILATSFLRTTADMQDFMVAMRHAGPVGYALGMSLNDLIATFGSLRQAGFNAGQTGTALRAMLYGLASPTGAMSQILNRAGIALQYNADHTLNWVGTLERLRIAFREGRIAQADLMRIGGARGGGGALLALMNMNAEQFNNLLEETRRKGAMTDYVREQLRGLPFALGRLKAAWEELMISFTRGKLGETLGGILDTITSILYAFTSLPDEVKSVLLEFGLMVAIAPVLVFFCTQIATAIMGIGTAISFLAAHPILLVLTAIVLLGLAVYKVNKELRETQYVSRGLGLMMLFLSPVISAVQMLARGFYTVRGVVTGLISTFRIVGEMGTQIWRGLSEGARGNFDEALAAFENVGSLYQMGMENMISNINQSTQGLITDVEVETAAINGLMGNEGVQNPFYQSPQNNPPGGPGNLQDIIPGLPNNPGGQTPGGGPGGNGPNGGQGAHLLNTPVGPIIFGRSPWHYTMAVAGTY